VFLQTSLKCQYNSYVNINPNKIIVLSGHVGEYSEHVAKAKNNHTEYCMLHGYSYYFEDNLTKLFSQNELKKYGVMNFYWLKVRLAKKVLGDSQFTHIFWIDSDSIFVDMRRSLDDLVHKEKDLVFTGDAWDLFNTGHFMFSKSSWSLKFLDSWLELYGQQSTSIETTHKTDNGFIFEQPAAAILLSGGFNSEKNLDDRFNKINGYAGNKRRKHKFFCYLFSPSRSHRLFLSKLLVAREMRNHVAIVPQSRLNAYSFRLPGTPYFSTKGKIMHFVGNTKSDLFRYL
jgi:hypothetical protein